MSKPVGRGLCVGLNSVDPKRYGDWEGKLIACEADARSMGRLLMAQNFEVTTLTTRSATADAIFAEVRRLAALSNPGDLAVITCSSHGGQIPDRNGDELDGLDETTCAYDREIIDDEWYAAFAAFRAGVRVLFISDSCHSGTLSRLLSNKPALAASGVKSMPWDVCRDAYDQNREMYDRILAAKPTRARDVQANVLLLGGCQDEQLSYDGLSNGAFTAALLASWSNGANNYCYKTFHAAIDRRMNGGGGWRSLFTSFGRALGRYSPTAQNPSYYWVNRDAKFEASKPFTV